MSMIICPNCEKENPADRYYCDHCGFRLVAPEPPPEEEPADKEEPGDSGTLNPFSLPSRQPGETGDLDLDNIPDWLRTGEHKIPAGSERQSDSDWLSDLEDITFDVGQADSDDWLDTPVPDIEEPLEDPTPSAEEELRQWQDGPDDLDSAVLPNWLAESEEAPSTADADEPSLTSWLNEAELPEVAPTEESDEQLEGLTSFLASSDIESEGISEEGLGGLTGFLAELDNVQEPGERETLDSSPLDLIDPTPAAAELEAYRRGSEDLAPLEPTSSAAPDAQITESENAKPTEEVTAPEAAPTLSETELEAFSWLDEEPESTDLEPETTEVDLAAAAAEGPEMAVEPAPAESQAPAEFDLEADLPPELDDAPDAVSLDDVPQEPAGEDIDLASFTNWLEEIQETYQDPALNAEVNQADLITDPNLDLPEADSDETMVSEFLEDLGIEAEADVEPAAEPDWLSELRPGDTGVLSSPAEREDEAISPTEDAVPDWLSDIAPDTAGAASGTDLADDWLADITPQDTNLGDDQLGDSFELPSEQETAAIDQGLADEIAAAAESGLDDDWLSEVIEAGERDEPAAAPVPDYPDTIVVSPPNKPDTGQLEGVPEELAGADLPDWLADATVVGAELSADLPLSELEESEFLSQDDISYTDMPDWLQSEQTDFDSALDAALAVQGSEMVSGMGGEWAEMLAELPNAAPDEPETPLQLAEADIPDWLQELKPDENAPQEKQEPEEVTGVLAGVRGVIDVEPVIALPRQSQPMKLSSATGTQQKRAELLRQVAIADRVQAVQVGGQRARAIPLWARLTLVLALIGALLASQLEVVQNLIDELLSAPALPAPAADAGAILAGTNGQTVLVVVDYTPASAGELNPIAALLLEQLAAQNNDFIIMSQYPAGLPLARELTDGLTTTELGYLPGEAVGLRQLANCLSEADCGDFPAATADVGLILLFTSERSALQNWVEQVTPTVELPLIGGLSGLLAPLAAPYLESEQIDGALLGTQAAASYAADKGVADSLIDQARAQSIAVWTAALLILLGNIISLFGRRQTPRATSSAAEPKEATPAV